MLFGIRMLIIGFKIRYDNHKITAIKIMDIYEVITKLIGRINPIGETTTDNERFENLKVMCKLVEKLIVDINTVSYSNKTSYEFSKKRASDYANKFLEERLGILNN